MNCLPEHWPVSGKSETYTMSINKVVRIELEDKIFIIQCYCRTGQKLENGEWVYSINRCIEEFRQQFPNLPLTYAQLLKHIQACVIKFGEIGAITRKPGGGAPKKRTANLIEDVQQRMEHSPKKSVATLSQQVAVSAHKSRETMAFLQQFFDTRIFNFPARSPDLTILDYFIFPYLKNTIFKIRHQTIEELRNAIVNSCADITEEILINSFESMKRRVQLCLQNNGQHFQDLL
ncbi:transposable element tc3 transposase-like protein [Holotrichia oblita]|uniref:Transposable element tc3 transposase-like protein n=1 Tax=Holotrichia oblita TaxID=644536 RepID=A0ACB9T1T7_HOLOL|nr:transposable element tc3 transposase-like protein [Holotrichia oblita]